MGERGINNTTRKKLDELKITIRKYLNVAPTNDYLRKQIESRLFDKGELSNNMILKSRISQSNINIMKKAIRSKEGLLTNYALQNFTNQNRTTQNGYKHTIITDGGNHKYRTRRRRTRRHCTRRR